MTREDIIQMIEDEDVASIRLQFTDFFGGLKQIAVSTAQIDRVLRNKYCFDGDGFFDGKYELEDKLFLYPNMDTFTILPWRQQQGSAARMICDLCYEDGTPFEWSPRYILQQTVKKAADKGYRFLVDPECEFFLFHTDEFGRPTTTTHETAGYLDAGPTDLGENATRDIMMMLEDMGFDVEATHHEIAPGQHEIDFRAEDAMTIADTIQTFRYAVRSIAKGFGLWATFMPKPVTGTAGSGMHLNLIAAKDGENLFRDGEGNVKQEAYWFMGGIMKHAAALAAVANPTVNSYKRLMAGYQAPSRIVWSSKGWSSLLKLKQYQNSVKIEVRFPDGASNPYLLMATLIRAGIDGIENQIDPGPNAAEDKNALSDAALLPQSLKESIDALGKDELVETVLGNDFAATYRELKYNEWNEYMKEVSQWELKNYLTKF